MAGEEGEASGGCAPSSQLVLTVHRKNWLPLVPGPALAIDRMPAVQHGGGSFRKAGRASFKPKSVPRLAVANVSRAETGAAHGFAMDCGRTRVTRRTADKWPNKPESKPQVVPGARTWASVLQLEVLIGELGAVDALHARR